VALTTRTIAYAVVAAVIVILVVAALFITRAPHPSPRHANTNTDPDYTNTWSSDTNRYLSHTNTDPRTC